MHIQQLIDQLCATYVERSETIEPLVAVVIARRHAVLIGPLGTAKSSLVRDLAAGLGGLRFFSWLLTEFSVPEELFGPLDIAALEQGQYRRSFDQAQDRLTAGKLPEAELAFIDEVFKVSPAILNTLLSVMQERLFYNDGQPTPVPPVSLIETSMRRHRDFDEASSGPPTRYPPASKNWRPCGTASRCGSRWATSRSLATSYECSRARQATWPRSSAASTWRQRRRQQRRSRWRGR